MTFSKKIITFSLKIIKNNEIIFNKMRDYFYKIILDKIKRYIFKENYLQFDKLFLKEIRSCRIGANTR